MIPEQHTVRIFAEGWVSRNLQAISDPARLQSEVGCWAAQMTADARQEGIAGRDLAKCLGDLDDYLTAQYHQFRETGDGVDGLRDS